MNKTFVTTMIFAAGLLGLAACSKQTEAPAAAAPAAATVAEMPAPAAAAPATTDTAANGPQGDGEVLGKKP